MAKRREDRSGGASATPQIAIGAADVERDPVRVARQRGILRQRHLAHGGGFGSAGFDRRHDRSAQRQQQVPERRQLLQGRRNAMARPAAPAPFMPCCSSRRFPAATWSARSLCFELGGKGNKVLGYLHQLRRHLGIRRPTRESKTAFRLAPQIRSIKHGCCAAAWRVKGDARRGSRHARDRRSGGCRGKNGARDHRAGATMKSRPCRRHAPIQPASPHRHRSARARRCTSRRCSSERAGG